MRVFFLSLGCFLCLSGLARSQPTTISVDIAKAKFTWSWTQGTGGLVEVFTVKCGPASGSYDILVDLADPAARSVPVNQVVTASGTYFCVVTAKNTFGESGASNEVTFQAGQIPNPVDTLAIQAN